MDRWSVAVLMLVVCILQIAPTLAKPDFGITGTVQGSAAVRLASISLGQSFKRLNDSLSIAITVPSENLGLLYAALNSITNALTPFGTSAADALASSTLSMSDLDGTFLHIIDPLVNLQTAILVQVPPLLVDIAELAGSSVALQLLTEIDMIYVSTQNLIGVLIQLASSVRNVSDASQVSSVIVSRVQQAILLLDSNIERLTYTISSTGAGVGTANGFLSELMTITSAVQAEDRDALDHFHATLDRFEDSITFVTDCLVSDFADLRANVTMAFESIGTACSKSTTVSLGEYCVLKSVTESLVDSVTTDWERVVCVVKRHYTLLGQNGNVTEELAASYTELYTFGETIAQTVAANGPKALFCFNKYFRQVENLFLRLSDDTALCLNKESSRLRSLQDSLQHLFPTVVYDVEELLHHLELCDDILEQRDRCVSDLGELYEHLASLTHQKLELIEKLSHIETGASAHRLKLCALHSRYRVLFQDLTRLRNDLEDCTSVPTCPLYTGGPLARH